MPELTIPLFVFASIIFCWFVFAAAFLMRRRSPRVAETKRDPAARTGIALESIGYAIVWMGQRGWTRSMFGLGLTGEVIVGFSAVIIALVSIWLVLTSIRTLGRHWALAARIVEGHSLITDGPYRFVRHPIYTGMFGMLIATGLAVSQWYAIIIAGVIFWIGTKLRIRVEDRLLHEAFGAQFEAYVARTPPLVPRMFWSTRAEKE